MKRLLLNSAVRYKVDHRGACISTHNEFVSQSSNLKHIFQGGSFCFGLYNN